MAIVLILLVSAGLFISLIWHENINDEREEFHRMTSDRIGFLIGVLILATFIIKDIIQDSLKPQEVFILGAMALAKAISIIYFRTRH